MQEILQQTKSSPGVDEQMDMLDRVLASMSISSPNTLQKSPSAKSPTKTLTPKTKSKANISSPVSPDMKRLLSRMSNMSPSRLPRSPSV